MDEEFLGRLRKISREVVTVRQGNSGENYYVFEMIDDRGAKTTLPPIWLEPGATDREIREKLARTLHQSLHPETIPDDASVPSLKTEGRRA